MNKKSTYLIIALLFIIGALGWELLMKDKKTEKEQEEIEKEAEKIPDPKGIKVYEKNSNTQNGLFIGVRSVSSSDANCNFILPNGAEVQEYMKVGQGFGFFDESGESYDIRLLTINDDVYKTGYVIFDIKRGNQLEHPYREKLREQKLQSEKVQKDTEKLIKQLYSEEEVELK